MIIYDWKKEQGGQLEFHSHLSAGHKSSWDNIIIKWG